MYKRNDGDAIRSILKEGDSVLILGARQTGKTTLLNEICPNGVHYNFASPGEKLHIAKNPELIISEIRGRLPEGGLFSIDEIQKVPAVFDAVQVLLDDKKTRYQALLTGSSARKIKRGAVNTLPGRIIQWQLGPLTATEIGYYKATSGHEQNQLLLSMMTRGNLPGIQEMNLQRTARNLRSYVQTYLEQEILGDALTKDIGQFARFLTIIASRSGQIINYSALSQESGTSLNTIKHHTQVLIDTMTAYSIPGFSLSDTKTWLSTPRLILFDIGVRNAAAERVIDPKAIAPEYGTLFEQWVGLEILGWMRNQEPPIHMYYWRTTRNREVDWIVKSGNRLLAIEVKWSEGWRPGDFSHLEAFKSHTKERNIDVASLLVCRTEHPALFNSHHIIPPNELVNTLNKWQHP